MMGCSSPTSEYRNEAFIIEASRILPHRFAESSEPCDKP